jgi:chemotaxis protein MotB
MVKTDNMKHLLKLSLFAVASMIIISCGPSKKLKAANAQISDLNNQVSALNAKVAEDEKQIAQLKQENVQYSKEAQDCREAKEAMARKMDNLEKNLKEQGSSIHDILEKARIANEKLVNAGAEVLYKDGLVWISMPDKFLFKSGSSKVGDKGKEGLKVIAEVLNDNPKVKAIIIGNTDTVKVKGTADNWSLSTERANAVVRILRDTFAIDPARMTSAGKGKYNPVADNSTPEGREKNRRIEIVLNPDLSKLWEMLEEEH